MSLHTASWTASKVTGDLKHGPSKWQVGLAQSEPLGQPHFALSNLFLQCTSTIIIFLVCCEVKRVGKHWLALEYMFWETGHDYLTLETPSKSIPLSGPWFTPKYEEVVTPNDP